MKCSWVKCTEVEGIEVWWKSCKSVVKWSEMKCSDLRSNGVVWNLNGVKPNERVVKWSESLNNRVSIIIRRYVYHMRFLLIWLFCLSHFFHILLIPFCIIVYIVVCFSYFCLILLIMYSYCFVCSVLGIRFHCVLCIVCV